MPFFIIFLILPLAEIAAFAAAADEIGFFTALALLILNIVIGIVVVQNQGLKTVFGLRNAFDRRQTPLGDIFDGFCQVSAGILLIIPGFLTDILGFMLLIPLVRQFLRYIIRRHTTWVVDIQTTASEDIIEGEYEHIPKDRLNRPD